MDRTGDRQGLVTEGPSPFTLPLWTPVMKPGQGAVGSDNKSETHLTPNPDRTVRGGRG